MIHRITCKKCGAEFEVHIRYEEHMEQFHRYERTRETL